MATAIHETTQTEPTPAAPSPRFYIAGIGASAGGLEALERLFRAMPPDTGVAFVIVQHLSPDFRSLMDELLARHTRMPIFRVEDGMAVAPNSIYLIPPKKEMIISGGKLLLTDKDPEQDLSLPIDHFFRSLAQDAGPRAIAVVLSGTGSDGSRGIRDVHEAGGLVLVQNEETAKFDGMPRSAMDTGVVNGVMAPEEIPPAIQEYVKRPSMGLVNGDGSPDEVPPQGIQAIFKLLREDYGIDFSWYKPSTVARRIERRLSLNHVTDLNDYVEQIRTDPRELNSLYRDLLIGVTRFFRDREAFERLEKDILPDILAAKKPGEEVRVWVAGCATGEEAYSLAILLHERLRLLNRPTNVKIFATDVHGASLEHASTGVYDEETLAEVTPARLATYFNRRQDGFHIASDIRQMIVFARHNIIRDAPFTKIDLISCRNLLIYFQPAAQKKALSLFHFGLRTRGILFLGPSESPGELAPEFESVDDHWKIYRKRRDVRLPPDMRLPVTNTAPHIRVTAPAPTAVPFDATLLSAYDRLLELNMPPGILVTDRRQVVHTFGGAAQLLARRDGRPSTDILDLVDGELKLVLAGSLQRAAKDQAPVSYAGVRITTPAGERRYNLAVTPLTDRHMNLTHFFIALADPGAAPPPTSAPSPIDAQEASQEQLSSLESELRYTRENLQATIEELETSNEELQASNEELVASNEELQSTNEELHSVNEELYTVNAEYQRKIAELTELTDDMDNLLRSTDIGTIFVDNHLCIRKFTPQIGRAFDLLPQDVGRRIDSFSHNIAYGGLLEDVRSVLQTGKPVEKEVRHRHGNWFFLRILPYRSHTALEGAVLTLIDISLLKRAESRLQQISAIVDSSDDAIIGMDLEGHITSWNRGAQQLFGYEAGEIIGKSVTILRPSQDGPPAADWPAEVMERMRAGGPANFQVERVRRRKDGSLVDVLMSLSAIRDGDGTLVGVSKIARDVSERKRAMLTLAQRARMSALRADIGSILGHGQNLREQLQRCARSLVEGLDAGCLGIWTRAGSEERLELQAAAGDCRHLQDQYHDLAFDQTEIGRIAVHRQIRIAAKLGDDASTADLAWARERGLAFFAGYPLLLSGELVGVLGLYCKDQIPALAAEDIPSICYELAQCIQRDRAEQARRLAEEETREAVRRRDQFLAMLSHELRNPLAAVINASTLLEHRDTDSETLEVARGTIGRQARHMARLLDDLLDVSRVTRDRIEIRKQVVDLRQTARDAMETIRPLLASRRLDLEVHLPDQPVCVNGDPARLQQIQANLLSNAIKYTPAGGHVTLSVESQDNHAVIRVRDTGVGIPVELREKIFELFVQLERDPGSASGGMGVGLTLVKALVQLHGGTISVDGAPGRGSEFAVRLPAVSPTPLTPPATGPVAPLRGLRVVLVEDIPDIRAVTQRLLHSIGCEVQTAEDGPSGIEAIARHRPEVALIDIGLPELDGYEVARRIRTRSELDPVKLIAVTGFGQDDDRRRALESGFDAHLVKPVDIQELYRLLCLLGNRPC